MQKIQSKRKSSRSTTRIGSKGVRQKGAGDSGLLLGVDLGGTKVAAGLVTFKGRLVSTARLPSKGPGYERLSAKEQIEFTLKAMVSATREAVQKLPPRFGKSWNEKLRNISGVGLASAGPLDVEKGLIIDPANFGHWGRVAIVQKLQRALAKEGLNRTICFQNDAIAAALGEAWVGVTKGCRTHAMITLGTGIGTGVILKGQPAQSQGMGSEWGHHIIDFSRIKTLERSGDNISEFLQATAEGIASGSGMLATAKRRGFLGQSMQELAETAKHGDPLALEVFADAARAIACVFYNLSVGYHIEKFAVTGGLLSIQELFLPQAISDYQQMIRASFPAFEAPVLISKLGNQIGVIGAASLART